ncbi:MAG: hypothetical protein QNI96_04545 [Woeseiaceae bacterium]|nr:hypothetical protein [Woeseiaceae bacterium]
MPDKGTRSLCGRAAIAAIALAMSACGGSDSSGDGATFDLLPPEQFVWGSQPISVSPPPEGWRRDKAQQGGLEGVRFIKSRSVGEEIRIAEHYALDRRSRCTQLMELMADLENLSDQEFAVRLQRARFYVPEPINAGEKRWADYANESLDRARDAHRNDNLGGVRAAITDAFEQGGRIQYSLDEVVDRVMFHESQYDSFGQVVAHLPQDGMIGGEPSVSVDYTLDSTERDIKYYGRQAYVLKNNRLFVFTFHGLPENLPLFDQILETVTFPPSQCVL